jgi:putative ABC transport system substrate-binding protein
MLTRRRIVFALGAAALAPVASFAQQAGRVRRVGILGSESAVNYDERVNAVRAGLRELGYVEGKNIAFELRWADGNYDRLGELVMDLVRANVDVIFAPTPPAAQAARKATTTIPIVVAAIGDPVRTGLAASLAHPGGNVTGLTALGSNLSGKRLQILKEVVPRLSRVAVIWNPAVPDKVVEWKEIEGPARALKIELQSVEVRVSADFDKAFERIKLLRPGALLVLAEPLAFSQRKNVVRFAAQARLPTMFAWREAVDDGALIAYGPDVSDLYRRAATYIAKILQGAKPADLPIEEPARFDFAINMNTAKALGIRIPNSILVQATKVIGGAGRSS